MNCRTGGRDGVGRVLSGVLMWGVKFINGVKSIQLRSCQETIVLVGGDDNLVGVTRFPKEDENAPRMGILRKECPDDP